MTKVLIFENDDVFAGQLRAGLGALGCTVQVFKEGTPGLQAASKANPEIILLTVELPRVNGFSICNKLKKDPKLSSVPLLLLSSRSTQETFEQHKKLKTRADAYLHKPISVSDVIDEMRQFVSLSTLDAAGYDIADEHTSQVDDDEVVLLDDHDDLEIQTLASKSGKALSRHDDHRKTTEMDAVRVDAPPVGSNAPTPGPGPDERFMPQYGLSEDDDNEGETQIASRSAMEEAAIAARIGPPPKRAVSHGGAPPATKPSSPPTPPP
ncbi:MAG TPA: response regulator, partial [Polyangiaceae bacterium]|nr:response regulator [Polyangiaceae bacterium]